MAVMTVSAVLALIAKHACVTASLAPIMVGIAAHESGLDPMAIHRNANGTLDVGIAQINTSNFGWLHLTMETALDPCQNLAAGARVLFAKYNGNPPDVVKAAYAAGVTHQIAAADRLVAGSTGKPAAPTIAAVSTPPPCAPSWDAWALAACSKVPAPITHADGASFAVSSKDK
jgi:hypothetical protein